MSSYACSSQVLLLHILLKSLQRQQTDPDNRTTLASSVKKGMRMFRKDRPAAADSPLYENDYENEPSL